MQNWISVDDLEHFFFETNIIWEKFSEANASNVFQFNAQGAYEVDSSQQGESHKSTVCSLFLAFVSRFCCCWCDYAQSAHRIAWRSLVALLEVEMIGQRW